MITKSKICFLIGLVEIIIGIITFVGSVVIQNLRIFDIPPKPDSVYVFVISTALIAFVLGMGLIFQKEWARKILIFFSGYVIMTKILIYAGLLSFSGAVMTFIPAWFKDAISTGYHLFVVIVLTFQNYNKR